MLGLLISEPLFLTYLLVFGVAALACFVSVRRAQGIDDPNMRRGLVALLLTSGGWATAYFFPDSCAGTQDYLLCGGVNCRVQHCRSMAVVLFGLHRSVSPPKSHRAPCRRRDLSRRRGEIGRAHV